MKRIVRGRGSGAISVCTVVLHVIVMLSHVFRDLLEVIFLLVSYRDVQDTYQKDLEPT